MAQDEGAAQTLLIMQEVKKRRLAKQWSAVKLAEEMTAAGVPWDRSVVANLENGRRKSLCVHELLALAYVLDVDSPVELLVPNRFENVSYEYPVTPTTSVGIDVMNEWLQPGSAFTLGKWVAMSPEERADNEAIRKAWTLKQVQRMLASVMGVSEEALAGMVDKAASELDGEA